MASELGSFTSNLLHCQELFLSPALRDRIARLDRIASLTVIGANKKPRPKGSDAASTESPVY
jgi:hypothetical protein